MDARAEAYVLFELAGTAYALPSRDVVRMEMIEQVTPVPNALPHVEGVVFSRGRVVPALSLRRRFGFERIDFDLRTRLVVVAQGDRTVGLIVDSAREFVEIPADAIQPPPENLAGTSGHYLHGVANVGERVILVLDVAGLLETSTS
jgi:chemotaxis signal transduction protein